MTDKLEETLLHIRSDLTNLSTDRLAMETKMEGLVSDIQILANSLYNYKRPDSLLQTSPVRRVRSSTASSKSSIKKRSSLGKQFPSFRRESSHRIGSVSSVSYDSIRGRSSSASSSSMKGESGLGSNSKMGDRSISIEGSWTYSDIAIPELPESPSLASVASCNYSSAPSSQDSSISGTFQKRTEPAVPPTPPYWQSTQQYYSCLVTSTPNMQYCGTELASNDNYYTLPSKMTTKGTRRQHCVMLSSDNLNEVDGCLEESSLSQENSSFVIRRSSLTGQLEHFQRPQSKEKSTGILLYNGTPGYRVLNKGVRKSLKRRSSSRLDQVILPGVETTV